MTNAQIVSASSGNAWHSHISIVRELERLEGIDELPIPVAAVAGNLQWHSGDTARAVRELAGWGIVRYSDKRRWDYPGEWITL